MIKIIIKEIDRLYSSVYKNKYTSEYLFYLMENDITTKAGIILGNDLKNKKINLVKTQYPNHNIIIDEITFDKYIK